MASVVQSAPIVGNLPSVGNVVEEHGTIQVRVPERPLAKQSLQIGNINQKNYLNWDASDSSNAFGALQKTVSVWKERGIADQYLVYGKQQFGEVAQPFNWEIVPYTKPSTIVGRFWQQFKVLLRITFGGATAAVGAIKKQLSDYKVAFGNFTPSLETQAQKVAQAVKGNDAFCQPEVIAKQSVLEGKKIHVLYNYAPIGFGGERLHFLFVPKAHRKSFEELSKEEYLEATQLAKTLIQHLKKSRPIQDVYLFHKTGKDAGQTVDHWHMHMILENAVENGFSAQSFGPERLKTPGPFTVWECAPSVLNHSEPKSCTDKPFSTAFSRMILTASQMQGFFGKLTVLKNMLLGSSPMKDPELKERVTQLRGEFKPLH